jgi:hypothetical protein
MQNLSPSPNAAYRGVGEALFRMVKYEGVLRPVRGMSAVVLGAGPAHALYFSCYEYIKNALTQGTTRSNHLAYGELLFINYSVETLCYFTASVQEWLDGFLNHWFVIF